jgi:hypothetical protein
VLSEADEARLAGMGDLQQQLWAASERLTLQ